MRPRASVLAVLIGIGPIRGATEAVVIACVDPQVSHRWPQESDRVGQALEAHRARNIVHRVVLATVGRILVGVNNDIA
ncbi:hypothetical protein K227x_61100 [Rubripirellula lacrimiformis]|uniref:Uncharacterized protein n=1 Tax=Rubripirellula lacrimiformis TaxID=1930273 RepID=A0A517NKL6_9BACT|nr:hypothetical protein K227x_61100 [Rubripirellula lacrimiformis]